MAELRYVQWAGYSRRAESGLFARRQAAAIARGWLLPHPDPRFGSKYLVVSAAGAAALDEAVAA